MVDWKFFYFSQCWLCFNDYNQTNTGVSKNESLFFNFGQKNRSDNFKCEENWSLHFKLATNLFNIFVRRINQWFTDKKKIVFFFTIKQILIFVVKNRKGIFKHNIFISSISQNITVVCSGVQTWGTVLCFGQLHFHFY